MIALYRDPEGKKVFEGPKIETTEETGLGISEQAEKCRILALEKEIEMLQEKLKQQQTGKVSGVQTRLYVDAAKCTEVTCVIVSVAS